MRNIKTFIRFSYPAFFKFASNICHPIKYLKRYRRNKLEIDLIRKCPDFHRSALKKVEGKKNIKCVFFVVHHQVWKYDNLYKMMIESSRFTPIILICPVVDNGEDNMKRRMDEAYNFFCEKNYNVVLSYNADTGQYIDVKSEIVPDIIFYTNPYEGLIDNRYYIKNFQDVLTVYVPYAFDNNKDHKLSEDLLLRNLVWRCYVETEEFLKYSKLYARNKGRNVVVTGYPGIDQLLDSQKEVSMRLDADGKKIVIWAPHHSLEAVGNVYYSCFLFYADFMITMAEKYRNQLFFVFKPHPLLKDKLIKLWGKDKTENYYSMWNTMPNTMVREDDYIQLFIQSDAMIHDCGSFITEYLYARKPVMRMMNNIPIDSMFNDFTKRCLDSYYKAYNENDVELFLQNIINGIDPLKEQRDKHFVKYLLPPKGKKPSENIYDDILDSIDNQLLYRN